jgi:hypothetical protein
MPIYDRVVTLVKELHLTNNIFFNDHWVPYDERANYFLEADIGVSAHPDHIETRFSFRTRLLDYIWARLPMVVSRGDTLAELVEHHRLGIGVDVGDVEGFAMALLTLASQPNRKEQFADAFTQIRQAFMWPEVLKPLLAFCQNPHYAADKHRLTLVNTYQRRLDELDTIIAQKNEHIGYLEGLIKQIESGRVMRLMRWLHTRGKK